MSWLICCFPVTNYVLRFAALLLVTLMCVILPCHSHVCLFVLCHSDVYHFALCHSDVCHLALVILLSDWGPTYTLNIKHGMLRTNGLAYWDNMYVSERYFNKKLKRKT